MSDKSLATTARLCSVTLEVSDRDGLDALWLWRGDDADNTRVRLAGVRRDANGFYVHRAEVVWPILAPFRSKADRGALLHDATPAEEVAAWDVAAPRP
jgi:hypothetical protein